MASNNTTSLATSEMTTVVGNLTFFDKLSTMPTQLVGHKDMLILELRIVCTALACIYIGSHGALRRPPSARAPKKGRDGKKRSEDDEDQFVQGLLPSDAIMFPILAGTVLVGLYYLIKWLEDPDILNKILRVYFSTMSVASMGKLFADALHLLTGFVFPSVWIAGDGTVYRIDPERKGHWSRASESSDKVWHEQKNSPFPGRCSEMKLSDSKIKLLWEVRHLLLERWTVRIRVHSVMHEKLKIRFNDILGVVLSIGVNMIYYATSSTMLSNVMGYAFSYGGIILMSPTTFATGSAVLFGLFFYDIYMVFYTPYMVTVATKLDVPIKLIFEGPTKASMLGLGDIVIPGMFIGLCLRFDNFLFYYRQRQLVPVELKTEDESSGQLVTRQETQRMVIKPEYVNPQGQWGDRFWGTKISKMLSPTATSALKASAFPKTYFHAAMVGYLLSMMTTLAMLLTFKHAQPALLYLVPGVVTAVWLTGAVRGELKEMWMYTEDGSLDKTDVVVEVDGHGNVIEEIKGQDDEKEEKSKEVGKEGDTRAETKSEADKHKETSKKVGAAKGEGNENGGTEMEYPVFLFSIDAPPPRQ